MIANTARFLSAALLGGVAVIATETIADIKIPPKVEIHYGPAENLERIDIALIDSAQHSIKMAAYLLTDNAVATALSRAIARKVQVKVVVDCRETDSLPLFILESGDVWSPSVICHHDLMHLKAYMIDGKVLRTGSANFSYSGLLRQDNDLVIIRDQMAVSKFKEEFNKLFGASK